MPIVQSMYATWADIQVVAITPAAAGRFGQAAVEAALRAASSIADSYLASQFTLPLKEWDDSLRREVCNIAAYQLYAQFGFNPNTSTADDLIKLRYHDALAWLKQIRDKELFPQWIDATGGVVVPDEAGPYVISDPPVGFTTRGVPQSCDWNSDPWWWR